MARTRGSSSHVHHTDDGELLDKEGKPIPTTALHDPVAAMEALARIPNQGEPAPKQLAPTVFRCDASTCQRDMDAFELVKILGLLGVFEVEIDVAQFQALPADVKRHFRGVS